MKKIVRLTVHDMIFVLLIKFKKDYKSLSKLNVEILASN